MSDFMESVGTGVAQAAAGPLGFLGEIGVDQAAKMVFENKTKAQIAAEDQAAKELAAKNAKITQDRADYVAASQKNAGRAGLNLTDAERTGAGIYAPNMGSPYPFVTR